ncbi:MAG: hypothetical protein HQL06_16975 [Nitrospirae bacterium]|nr:hypothetical protein [Nitrospirota bacterium]
MTFEDVMMGFEAIRKDFIEIKESFKETNKAINNLTDKWGNFVVGLVLPAMQKMFQEKGIVVETISRSVQSKVKDAEMEIDILAVNGEYVVAVEIKSTLGVNDVDDHIERLAKFKQAFKVYADRNVIGAVAGIVINEGVDRYAYKNGLFVIGQSGDTVKILNDDKFEPRCF